MSDKNELSWEDYEAITKYIYGALGEQYGIEVIGYGRNCKVKGKSGISYQIDVLTEQSDGEKTHRTAIECKFLNEKVTNDTVMKLQCIMEDAGIESGIIVCKTGFTRDTLIYAEHKGIKLVELWEAGEKDEYFKKTVEIGILNFYINAVVSRGVATSVYIGDKIITIADEQELMNMNYVRFSDANGNTISLGEFLGEFSKELQNRRELLKTTTIIYPLNRTLFYKQPSEEIAFDEIAITGYFAKIDKSSKRSFYLTDQVWMIMNELFDKRKLTLSKSGLIWNLSSVN